MQVRSRLLFLSVKLRLAVGAGGRVGGGGEGGGRGVGVKPGRNGYRPVMHDFFVSE